ncbi:solute carrier family 15 member 2-like isoform X1 [Exaiptasia diaphana]|uniref:Uncharacterized protein n=1 Tax=Exaiptasia diaphana TaxID=2652724 RepID=A0A913XGM4_EXADI|nr:solute carrier family 15 member 2-like isoform X1 [Exaiptasia diaphana]
MSEASNGGRSRVSSFDSIDIVDTYEPSSAGHNVETNSSPKISGRAWGRVKKFLLCSIPFPKSIYFIIGNEFCERFSYYGMKAILFIYLSNELNLSKDNSTAIFHSFSMLCYFTPLFGAMLADGWIGKYRTILYISIIYAIGNIIVSITAVPDLGMGERPGPMIGLLLIAIGTGGIKPCVSAFGGDQFSSDQEHLLQSFFSIFYFSINAGSLLSMLITPLLRGDIQCFGKNCYSLAFGVPALLMLVAVILFWGGRHGYKRRPPNGNIVWLVTKATTHALKRKLSNNGSKDHWMDWADDKYDIQLIEDIKALYRVLFMFLPLPFFWTLFDQQGSRWVLQATQMDGSLGALGTLKPDQMQALNPVFIILLIPVFEGIIYKVFFKPMPLKRMCAGMLLAATAFVIAGLVQLKIQASQVDTIPPFGKTDIRFVNSLDSKAWVAMPKYNLTMDPHGKSSTTRLSAPAAFDIVVKAACGNYKSHVNMKERLAYDYIIGCQGNQVTCVLVDRKTSVPAGKASLCIVVNRFDLIDRLFSLEMNGKIMLENVSYTENNNTRCISVPPKHYILEVKDQINKLVGKKAITLDSDVVYTLVLSSNKSDGIFIYKDMKTKLVSMLWQIPQYFVITSGEILFSITGLEFAYSQAPASMKSCLQAAWLLTVAFGNLVVVIEAETHVFDKLSTEFFFFAAMLGVVMVIFLVMSLFYKYVQAETAEEEDNEGIVNEMESF